MAKMTDVTIRVENVKSVAQLLADAYEAIAALHSEAWDVLSEETRQESSDVMRRLDEIGDGL